MLLIHWIPITEPRIFSRFSFIKNNMLVDRSLISGTVKCSLIHPFVLMRHLYLHMNNNFTKFIYCASSAAPFNCCDGGTKWSGSTFGNSLPSSLMFMRCMAKANSSMSKKPSPSQSDNFHILLRTEFGNFDFWSSDLAAVILWNGFFFHRRKLKWLVGGYNKSEIQFLFCRTCSADFAINWFQWFENWVSSLTITTTNPVAFAETCIDSFSTLIAKRWDHIVNNTFKCTAWKNVWKEFDLIIMIIR